MGGVAVQRITKFCKFLPEFGWQPIVLTVKNGYWINWDYSLREYKTGHEIVYRTHFYSPFTIIKKLTFGKVNYGTTNEDKGNSFDTPSIWRKVMRNISMIWCIPDEFISWLPFAYYKGLKIIEKHGIDIIFANDSPHTCSIIAMILSKTTGIPFISDFRDLWTSNPDFDPRNKLENLLQHKLENSVLGSASKVITVTNGFAKTLATLHGKNLNSKLEIIYNGFDLDDFSDCIPHKYHKIQNKFRIVYTGSFFSNYMNPERFLKAFNNFIKKSNLNPYNIEVLFIGSKSDSLKRLISLLNLEDYITLIENLPHQIACSIQKTADILLLILFSVKGGENRVPGKLLEYLAAGAPILAIAPEGEVTQIINKTGAGIIVNPNDIKDIERCLTLLYLDKNSKPKEIKRNDFEIKKFSRYDQVKQLSELFNYVVHK